MVYSKYSLLRFLISFVIISSLLLKETQLQTHPLTKNEHYEELFSLFQKLQEKKYLSPKEYAYRMKIFKDNVLLFIKKNDDPLEKVYVKNDDNGKSRLYIVPDKTISVDLNDAEDDQISDHMQFELNKFADISQKEFESIYLLDQSFFDEKKNPPYFNPGYNDQLLGMQNIEKYIQKLKKLGYSLKYDINKYLTDSKSFFEGSKPKDPEQFDSQIQLDSVTPHFSTDKNFKSIWDLDDHDNATETKAIGFHSDFHANNRILQSKRIRLPETIKSISIDGVMVAPQINWGDLDVLTPIKDQIKCNACYAFSALGAVESHHRINNGNFVELAEQEIVDCSRTNNRCTGGLPQLVFQYIQNYNISYMADYPYDGLKFSQCRRKAYSPKYNGNNIFSYTNLPQGILSLIKNLTRGPIANISFASYFFKQYGGGIYRGQGCFEERHPNHSSLLIGYNLIGDKYFLFKNGWGKDWGEKGFYKVEIKSLSSNNLGHCLIAATSYNSIPFIF